MERTWITGSVLALIMTAIGAGESWAQRGIPIVRTPSVHAFGPHGAPHGSGASADSQSDDPDVKTIVGSLLGLVVIIGGWLAAKVLRNKQIVDHITVVETPPGEAPPEIRNAWVGVTLPLRRTDRAPKPITSVGVLSQQDEGRFHGYAVDGRLAVEALALQSPQAAAWWKDHAKHVLNPGYRLFFPTEMCQRTGDAKPPRASA